MSVSARPFDVVILGATGFTGRQAVRAMRRQGRGARWAIAGRNVAAMQALVGEGSRRGVARPGLLLADTTDAASLAALAAQARVLVNLAGPYAMTGEAVIEACIAHGAHYFDLSGETFWVRRMIERHHAAAAAAGVRIIPTCGYEALPFDLATLWIADALRQRHGQPCSEVKILVRFTGKRITRIADAASGGTVATLRSLLEHDRGDSMRNVACLLPAGRDDAAVVARRNAIAWTPRYDADAAAVIAPTVPAPFVNPPMVLRSWALLGDESLFTRDFRYREGTHMGALVGAPRVLPAAVTLPLQFTAGAALCAPLAGLGAALAVPLTLQRQALRALIERFAPQPGEGPSEAALDGMGYAFDIFATAADGQRLRGAMTAEGHPGYRSTPEMLIAVALGLAQGALGRTPHAGVVTPASGLGLDAADALRAAGVRFSLA